MAVVSCSRVDTSPRGAQILFVCLSERSEDPALSELLAFTRIGHYPIRYAPAPVRREDLSARCHLSSTPVQGLRHVNADIRTAAMKCEFLCMQVDE